MGFSPYRYGVQILIIFILYMCIEEILNNLAEAHTSSNWQSQDLNLSPLCEEACVIHSKACASNHTRWE